ncbi:MAG: nucleoid-associated protein [Haloplasmataceae bacterium]|jgi:DNA-binding YbaB/EbfC family protein|nr:nucleoid-associated protein [Haloplasmataceae bacterium]
MNQALLKKLQKMQRDMEKAQKELEETVFTGTAGGVVTIEMLGTKEVKSVKVKPEAVDPEDVEMLEDMILAALNDASRHVDQKTKEVMSPFTQGMPGMPGLF